MLYVCMLYVYGCMQLDMLAAINMVISMLISSQTKDRYVLCVCVRMYVYVYMCLCMCTCTDVLYWISLYVSRL